MMTILSTLFAALTGPLLRVVTIPLLCAAALVGFHTLVENWKGNLRAEGVRMCDARWEQTIREEERKKSAGEIFAARELLSIERGTTERLNGQLNEMYLELEALRGGKPTSGNPRNCLSDGVLDKLGPVEDTKRGKSGAVRKAPTS